MLFFALGVFALLFGFAGDAHAVQCQGDRDNVAATLWNKGGICDFPITYDDPGGSGLVTCQYQAINWTESIDPDDPAGWGPAVANPDSCTGTTALMKSGGIVIGSAGNCTLNGPDTCHLYWKAIDGSNNSASGFLASFDVDYVGPTLVQVTAVPSPTNDTTPNYTFNSTEAGTISYGGDCSSAATSAVAGDNTVTFNILSQGTHSNCTITVTDAVGNPSSALNVNSFTIDTLVPTVFNVTSAKANGSYTVGEIIDVTVSFSESVTVTGTPQLTLATGGVGTAVSYFSGSPGTTLTFRYIVAIGHNALDLDYTSTSALGLNGGTIRDAVGNNANRDLATPGFPNSLGASRNIVIDTIAPAITAFSINGSSCSGVVCPVTVFDKDALDIVWTASDNAGESGVQKHEIWRAQDTDGDGSPNWSGIPYVANATSPYTAENPAEGTYWYGIHTLDNAGAGNCISEEATHCGGTGSDSYDVAPLGPRTVRGPIKVVMDKTAPTVTINQAFGQADPTGASSIEFTVVFSEPVTGFTDGDVNFTGSTAGGTLAAAVTPSSGATYTAIVTGMTSDGSVIAGILAGRATDVAGNSNTAATATDKTVIYSTVAPSVDSSNYGSWGTSYILIDIISDDNGGTAIVETRFSWGSNEMNAECTSGGTVGTSTVASTEGTSVLYMCTRNQIGLVGTQDRTYYTDQTDPSVSADNASSSWFSGRTTTLSVSDSGGSGLVQARYSWDSDSMDAACTSGGTTFVNGAVLTVSAGSHRLFLCARDGAGRTSTWDSGADQYRVDTQPPIITMFTITPDSSVSPNWANNASPSITVTWNVSDQGDSHLDRVRVYRAIFDSTDPDGDGKRCDDANKQDCVWIQAGSDAIAPANADNWNCDSTCSSRVIDSPGSGTWWYGMHVWDKAQNETIEPMPPGVKKVLVDTINPSTAVTNPAAATWFKDNFTATFDDSDIGGSGLVPGASGCQYRFIGDNPSGADVCSGSGGSCPGNLVRQCDPVTKTITVGLSDVCRFEGIGRCRVETKSFDAAGNTSINPGCSADGWCTRLFGVDFTNPVVGSPAPNSAQSGVSTNYSATLRDPIGKITGCGFYWRAVGGGIWNTGAAPAVNPIPCENNANCTVSVDHTFASVGSYETQFGCTDQATNTGWGGVTTVQVGSLSVNLSSVPSPGGSMSTLFDLAADTAGSTMLGDTAYGFDCRIDTGDCTADGNFDDCDFSVTTSATAYTAVDLCQYPVTAGTYTAKVAVQRGVGTAEDTVAIGSITTNSAPTAIPLSVDPANPTDYCGVTGYPPVRVHWAFSDADPGDTQSAYQIQVFQGAVKVVDTDDNGRNTGTTQEYVFQSAGEQLLWNETYTWQVKVWDSPNDNESSFSPGPQFTTPAHYYPDLISVPGFNFTWAPNFPGIQELVQFTDQTNFDAAATGKTRSWNFGDPGSGADNTSTLQDPSHSFTALGAFEVLLEAGDNVGSCSASQPINVTVPFPEWQEISPF